VGNGSDDMVLKALAYENHHVKFWQFPLTKVVFLAKSGRRGAPEFEKKRFKGYIEIPVTSYGWWEISPLWICQNHMPTKKRKRTVRST